MNKIFVLTICKHKQKFNTKSKTVRPFFTKSKISEKEGKTKDG